MGKTKISALEKYLEEYTDEEKKIIRTQFFPPSATDKDMIYCMNVAKQLGLNPILKEIFFVERRMQVNGQWVVKIEPMLGRDSYLTIAHRSGKFDGIESWVEIKKYPKLKGTKWVEEEELVGIALVYRKDFSRPVKVEVPYSEYVQRKKNGDVTTFWANFPTTMIKKVAESQALRKAFNIRGAIDAYAINEEEEIVTAAPAQEDDVKKLLSEKNEEETTISANDVELEAEKVEHSDVDNTSNNNIVDIDEVELKGENDG